MATDDSYSLDSLDSLVISAPGVLENDMDPESDPLATILGTGPTHGTLLLNADGSFEYTPEEGYVGNDSFTYRITDGLEESGLATVCIEVLPLDPAPGDGGGDDGGDDGDTGDPDDGGDGDPGDPPPEGLDPLTSPDDGSQPRFGDNPSHPDSPQAIDPLAPLDDAADLGEDGDPWDATIAVRKSGVIRGSGWQTSGQQAETHNDGETQDPVTEAELLQQEYGTLWNQLDAFREDLREDTEAQQTFETLAVGTTAVGITGLTVGYVFWLLQSGSLLASVIATLPAWCSFDPLPVLGAFEEEEDDDEEDDDSLESLVTRRNQRTQPRGERKQES